MSGATLVRPRDQEERRAAISELDRNVVVLAGAGTGKTTLLTDRLALLILAKGIPIEKIVALTFTKKAAEEMRVRLEFKLRALIKDLAEDDLNLNASLLYEVLVAKFGSTRGQWTARAQAALQNIPKAQLGTIHSFAGYLLRLFPVQAG